MHKSRESDARPFGRWIGQCDVERASTCVDCSSLDENEDEDEGADDGLRLELVDMLKIGTAVLAGQPTVAAVGEVVA